MTTTIQSPTNTIDNSKEFYEKLGYTSISQNDPLIFSDGSAIIEINPDRYARAGIKIYKDSWKAEIEEIRQLTKVHENPEGYMVNDSNGCWIYLIEGEFSLQNSVDDINGAIPGNFMGLSLEASDVQSSLLLWNKLGFEAQSGGINDGYVVLENSEGFKVSIMKPLMCPHLFFNPSMTYFNGKENLEIIEKVRATGITIAEEITHFNKEGMVDNIIVRDPGGYGFFIFND